MPEQAIRNGYVKHRSEMERRARIRFAKDEEVWCQPTTTSCGGVLDTAWLGRVRDLSAAGIGLSMTRHFEPGTALTIEVSERHLLAHVIHATREENGRWIIGCVFDSSMSERELQTFVGEGR